MFGQSVLQNDMSIKACSVNKALVTRGSSGWRTQATSTGDRLNAHLQVQLFVLSREIYLIKMGFVLLLTFLRAAACRTLGVLC
jgi:hypothetical protein